MQKNKSIWDKFTKTYQLTKTLRFELKPEPATAEFIKKNGIIHAEWSNDINVPTGSDVVRAEHYRLMKKVFDEIHRHFLDEAMHEHQTIEVFSKSDFKQAYTNWLDYITNQDAQKSKNLEKKLSDQKESLAKKIKELFELNGQLWQSEIQQWNSDLKIDKPKQILTGNNKDPFVVFKWFLEKRPDFKPIHPDRNEPFTQEELYTLLTTFYEKNFTTYFSGFRENRENIYETKELKKTGVAHRIIEENMDFYFGNCRRWEKIQTTIKNSKVNHNGTEIKIQEVLADKDWDFASKVAALKKDLNLKYDPEDYFKPECFLYFLSDAGINEYNKMIGGLPAEEQQEKKQGINEILNLTRQKSGGSRSQFPQMHQLYKQILSKKEKLIDSFEKDEEVLNEIQELKQLLLNEHNYSSIGIKAVNTIFNQIDHEFKDAFVEMKNDPELRNQFFLDEKAIRDLSITIAGQWNFIHRLHEDEIDSRTDEKGKQLSKTKRDALKKEKSLSFYRIETLLANHRQDETHLSDFKEDWQGNFSIELYYSKKIAEILKSDPEKSDSHETRTGLEYKLKSEELTQLLGKQSLGQDKNRQTNIDILKEFLEAVLEYYHFIASFQIKKELANSDSTLGSAGFRNHIDHLLRNYVPVIHLYNLTRNYVTKKQTNTEKIKLNFDRSDFFTGWAGPDKFSKADANIFKDKNYYYLALPAQTLKQEEISSIFEETASTDFQKIDYIFQKLDNKQFPRLFIRSKGDRFAPAVEECNLPINDIIDIYDNGQYKTEYRKKNKEEFKESLAKLIDYFKIGLSRHSSTRDFHFTFKPTKDYSDISEFYNDAIGSAYKLEFRNVNKAAIDTLVDSGKLYLFKIYNKDFSPKSTGKPNLHTIYWRALFDPDNLKDTVYKLNGQAELFFRPASMKMGKPTHPKGKPIDRKTGDRNKKSVFDNIDLYKNKRFRENKYLFHVPITMNFKAPTNAYLNQSIQSFLKNNSDVNIIGIDRGERHLLYYSVIDQTGKLLKQGSLNEISTEIKTAAGKEEVNYNYHNALDQKEKGRDQARKSWQSIETIKELKEGYLSQVVHKLAQLVIEHNAIVVLENLNQGFKRGRFKVEKQVYQKFEKTLSDKLSYLVFKDAEKTQPGGYLNAYQLSEPIVDFKKLGSQNGIIFYTPASYTSNIDPITGYAKNLYHAYKKDKTEMEFFGKFDWIVFNGEYFEFSYNLEKLLTDEFSGKAGSKKNSKTEVLQKTEWIVCSNVMRSQFNREKRQTIQIDVNSELKNLFQEHRIELIEGENLVPQIAQNNSSNEHQKFIKSLLYYFNLILNMRVSNSDIGEDYIQSPVEPFFHTNQVDPDLLPDNGDANGAYNIARKGICILNKIHAQEGDGRISLSIDKIDWFNYAQSEEIVKAQKKKYN